jgi:hypothetical protein
MPLYKDPPILSHFDPVTDERAFGMLLMNKTPRNAKISAYLKLIVSASGM